MGAKKQNLLKLSKTPTWITQDNIEYLRKPNFQRIVRFFVINTPDKCTSARGKEISEYGIIDEALFFEELMDGIENVTKAVTIEIPDLEKAGLLEFPPRALDERVCFAISKNKPVTSLFIKIRDSLAHGRFNLGGSKKMPYLIMEDINANLNCSARLVLKFSTLKHWIERIEEK